MERETQTDEQYIINESPEISIGESSALAERIYTVFPALQNKNYLIYFLASLVSLVGTWLQIVAEGWLVLQLTNSAFWVGAVGAAATFPTLIFSLFGGVIVDRFRKKDILIFTQTSAMILALVYGLLTVFHFINITEILILAFLLGIVTAIDSPARQAFVPKLVGQELLGSAIALNSGTFNAARVIGPSVAGILIAVTGSGGAFLLNGLSYIAVIVALFYMHVPEMLQKKHLAPLHAIREGITYSFSHPIIRVLLILTGIMSVFGWSYSTMLPVIAKNTFGMDASGLGYLYAASGMGALAATFVVSALSKRKGLTNVFILGGNTLFAIMLFLFTFAHSEGIALLILFFIGVGLLSQFTTLNTTLQHLVSDSVRGRVMSIYTLMFIGLAPLGNFEVGVLSDKFGTEIALRIGAAIVFLFGLIILFNMKRIQENYDRYKEA